MSAIHSPNFEGLVPKCASPAAMRLRLTASALSMNHFACSSGFCRNPLYGPWSQMPTRIWKNPAESASPPLRFLTPDSTSEAMTGSSGGRPAASARLAIHSAISSLGAPSPG